MAASFSDASFLAADTIFGNRVLEALMQACENISNEAWSSTHAQRKQVANQIATAPSQYKTQIVELVAVDATVLADATQAGAVVLTGGNAAAQAALVTDAHITNAISAAFNTLVSGI